MKSNEVFTGSASDEASDVHFHLAPVFLAIGIAVSAVMPVFLTGALAVQIRRDVDLSPSHLGAAVATFFAFAALSSFVSGRLSHRIDGAGVIKVNLIASSLVLVGIAAVAKTYIVYLMFLAASGIINGTLQPSINLFLSHVIPERRQGFAFGVKQAAVPVSTFLAGVSVPVIALTVGWRFAFFAAAPLGLILFFLAPSSILPSDSRGRHSAGPERPSGSAIAVLALAMGLGTGAANSFGAFLVSYVVHAGWHPGYAGLLTVVGSFIGVGARIGNGLWADRRTGKHFLVALWSLLIGGLGYLMFATGYGWIIIPATIISYGAGWGWNGLFIFGVVRNFTRYAGYATGTVQSGAYVGSVLGPLVFGLVVERLGYPAAWTFGACSALAAAGAIAVARRMIIKVRPGAVG